MTVVALFEVNVNPAALESAYAVVHRVLADTRAFQGCLGVEVLIDSADPAHLVFVEKWDSEAHDAAYRAWRATPEGASNLGELLTGRPTLTKFTDAPQI